MTNYQDDPNINVRRREPELRAARATPNSASMWIAGLAAVAVLIAIVAYAVSDGTTNTADNRPAITETRSTTGSGATTPPLTTGRANTDQGNPAGGVQTKPLAKPDAQQPGSSAPATNR
jgi:hypothetical protein